LLNGSKFLDEFVHFGEIKSLTQRVFLWQTIELLYSKNGATVPKSPVSRRTKPNLLMLCLQKPGI
jgi:hypothetical protein